MTKKHKLQKKKLDHLYKRKKVFNFISIRSYYFDKLIYIFKMYILGRIRKMDFLLKQYL